MAKRRLPALRGGDTLPDDVTLVPLEWWSAAENPAQTSNGDSSGRAAFAKESKATDWQENAFRYRREIGPIRYATAFYGGSMGRLKPFVGVRNEPGETPVPLLMSDERDPDEVVADDAIPDAVVEWARQALTDLGDVGEIVREQAENLFLVGEVWLVGIEPDGDDDGERAVEEWSARSIREVIVDNKDLTGDGRVKRIKLKGHPSDDGRTVVIDPDTEPTSKELRGTAIRTWRRDPEWSDLADSAMQSIDSECREFLLLARTISEAAVSRLVNGMLALPNQIDFPALDPTNNDPNMQPQGSKAQRFGQALMQHFATGIENRGSAAAQVPFVVLVEGQYIEQIRHIRFERDFPQEAMWREELRRAMAIALDLPPEVLEGKADLNHWTAWQIQEETFEAHLAPGANLIFDGLTEGYLQARAYAAIDSGVAPAELSDDIVERLALWYDASDLVGAPDRSDVAITAYDLFLLSDDALLRHLGLPVDEQPTEEEIAERLELMEAVGAARASSTFGAPEDDPLPEDDPRDASRRRSPFKLHVSEEYRRRHRRKRLARSSGGDVGQELSGIDRATWARVSADVDAAIDAAIAKAAAKIKGKVPPRSQASAVLAGVDDHRYVAATLGRPMLAELGLAEEDLIDEELPKLERKFLSTIKRAQAAALAVIERTGRGLTAAQRARIEARQSEDRASAWVALLASVRAFLLDALFDPDPAAPEVGEFDDVSAAPASMIRQALAAAGGGVPTPEAPAMATGVTSGGTVVEALANAGMVVTGWRWIYGDVSTRGVNFEPHRELELSAVTWTRWDDPALINPYGWPLTAFFYPGDHRGCQCDVAAIVAPAEEPAE